MNYKVILNFIGTILKYIGFFMVVPLILALYYGEPLLPFLIPAVFTTLSGILIESRTTYTEEPHVRESIAIVAFVWLVVSLYASLPFILMERPLSPLDALFESMSGFTTTGSSVIPDVEALPRSILFWRSFIQWLGGMGIIVLFIAVLPKLSVAGRQLLNAEVTGPTEDKLRPRIRETAGVLWGVYLGLTFTGILLLYLAGMPLFDSVNHVFAAVATGGFSTKNASVMAYGSPLIELVLVFVMFMGGASFALHYRMIYADRTSLVRDKEFQVYFSLIAGAIAIIAFMLWRAGGSAANALMDALFQVVSIMTTTGFASVDFDRWPDAARFMLLILMFVGGCAGSTAGGIKVVRLIILLKYGYREMFRTLHPKAIKPIWHGGRAVPEDILQSILSFFILYIFVFVVSAVLLGLMGLDMITSASAAATALGNVGPGFNVIGPMANFSTIPQQAKIVLILDMWIGRLEIFTVLSLLVPEFWKK
ncbi:MAG TPA: TrkH family potassium uptake protein [Candidatus Methanoperedenaceae archaeon]|nr:TrkH family potassium uptake protein [Candidatus Methanoperedenaceae archaeon]